MSKAEATEAQLSRLLEQGSLDFSAHASVSNAAGPGVLVHTTTLTCLTRVTDVVIYNADASAAVVTLYDEDSTIMLVVSLAGAETAVLELKSALVYNAHNIWARTTAVANAEVTVSGKEIPPRWQ